MDADDYVRHDGSGLSRQRESRISPLPVGEDGTLETRMNGAVAAGRIRAKTGALSHVTALSEYAERAGGGTLAFSIPVKRRASWIVDKI